MFSLAFRRPKLCLSPFAKQLWLAVIFLHCAGYGYAQSNPANFITVREKAGVAANNYPIQIGRPFMPGEILNFPRAVVGSTAVATQADVKSRWPDGSVKHAVLTFYLPALAANASVTVTFVNQATGNNANALSKRDMLHKQYNFDARIEWANVAILKLQAIPQASGVGVRVAMSRSDYESSFGSLAPLAASAANAKRNAASVG